MLRSTFWTKWRQRVTQLLYLPLTNQALKYFPPEFTLRDPIFSLVHRHRSEGHGCALLLFNMENYHTLLTTFTGEMLERMHAQIKQLMKEQMLHHWKAREIIGVRQVNGESFCLYIRCKQDTKYDELQQKAQKLRKDMEQALKQHAELPFAGKIHFQVGCQKLDMDTGDTRAALLSAFHYAHAIATKKLSAHFSHSRQQLHEILNEENITVLAQPIIRLRDSQVYGWEFLTRGPRDTPYHLPDELFDFAYQADLLTRLELVVIKKVFQEISVRGIREQVFINVTAVSLNHPLFLQRLMELLDEYAVIMPCQIVFEITERHSIRDFDHMNSILRSYRSHGFRFAVDDAGAGYSSLQSISELIPDIIKIDKSVIQNIDQTLAKQSLLKALLLFAENINCEVVAEGVERQEEADVLLRHEVQMGQGYFFAKPGRLLPVPVPVQTAII
ncbi:EAL domain-containing protein [Paenibacillus sp. y28]|uniref:EAL domain-containing protein n=1 Tax=Paenibacillus sp. y28 TaxID=3129110 RepID=UPI003019BCF7